MSRRLVPVRGAAPAAAGRQPPAPPPDLPVAPAAGGPIDAAVDTLARTLWGEARGEPVRGIEAVAAVVVNRVRLAQRRGGMWWGSDIVAVCRKPWQFSCWNADDPNRAKLLAVTAADPVFATCLRVARRAGAASAWRRPGASATRRAPRSAGTSSTTRWIEGAVRPPR